MDYSRIHIRVKCETRIGESIGICGSSTALGNFSTAKVVQLYCSPETFPYWQSRHPIVVSENQPLAYNYCIIESGKFRVFEKREKRVIVPVAFEQYVDDECTFNSTVDIPTPVDGESSLKARLRKRAESIDNTSRLASFERLIIVCYHLPVVIRRTGKDSAPFDITWAESLIAKSMKDSITSTIEVSWLGTVTIPGDESPTVAEIAFLVSALKGINCIPIFLDDVVKRLSYFGFCKEILWPLFHNVDQLDHIHAAWNVAHIPSAFQRRPSATGASVAGRIAGTEALHPNLVDSSALNEPVVDWEQKSQNFWPAYQQMNSAFVPVLAPMLMPGDVVWVHDYHLALLPKLLRETIEVDNVSIVYFSHIPFPTSQVRIVRGHI